MKTILLALALLLAPLNAHAQDVPHALKLPTILFVSAASADWTSTEYCISSGKCREANPLYAWSEHRFGVAGVIAIGASVDVLTTLAIRRVGVKHPRMAACVLYVSAGLRFAIVARNTTIGYRVRQATY